MKMGITQFLFVALTALVASVAASPNMIVDLSLDFALAPSYNNNPGATSLVDLAASNDLIRSVVVLEHGQVVADYAREGVEPTDSHPVWSVTKSWTGLLLGLLVQDGLLSLDETLGDVFPDAEIWETLNATDVDFRKAITIEEILTMTSGLKDPPDDNENDGIESSTPTWHQGGTLGGGTLQDSLAYPDIRQRGSKTFKYLASSNILSYVIQQRSGMTPGDYLEAKVLPHLGIQRSDFKWWQNQDGVEYASHGLVLTPLQMAKWGQLYLQQGQTRADHQLLDATWVQASTTLQSGNLYYGYLTWVWLGQLVNQPELGTIFCASGLGGQDICVSPLLDRVLVQQWDLAWNNNNNNATAGDEEVTNTAISALVLNPNTSFVNKDVEVSRSEEADPLSDIIIPTSSNSRRINTSPNAWSIVASALALGWLPACV